MSGTPNTPIPSKESKKRELSSPEFDTDNKKNRILSDSLAESDISGLDVDTMASNMETAGLDNSNPSGSNPSSHVTLRDEDLQKIASFMKESFQNQVIEITQASLQQSVTELVNSIVSGVLSGLNSKITLLENENRQLQQRIQQLETAADNAEQYSRRNCLRISGVQEAETENTDDIVLNLARSIDVELSISDIDRSHRLGKPGLGSGDTSRPRDIVVKFVSYRSRVKFYKARVLTKTRGYRGVFINEHLTRSRGKLLYQARRLVKSRQLKSAWTSDGVVLVKHLDDTVRRITRETELPTYVPSDDNRSSS